MTDIVRKARTEISDPRVSALASYLHELGLPSENILASATERQIVGDNLPSLIKGLDERVKNDAVYLSRFTVGASLGLFDYALNSIWNEVVISLRKKADAYGLDIFFDAAVGGTLRASYSKSEDLSGLKDSVLLTASRKLEIMATMTFTNHGNPR